MRPFGDSAHVKRGWEPFTNSYPEYGRGGALQYKAGTRSFDESWVHPLENTFGTPKAGGPRTGGPEVTPGLETPGLETPGLETPGLETRGYKPAPGERVTTRDDWKAQQRRSRAENTVAQADKPLENPNSPSTHGHGHARHGSQTTSMEQAEGVRSGMRPDGTTGSPLSTTSRFRSPEAEAEALGRGRRLLNEKLRSGTVQNDFPDPVTGTPTYVDPVTGSPTRVKIDNVTTNDVRGYGDGFIAERDAVTNQIIHPDPANPTYRNPVPNPANPLMKADIVYEYVPSTGKWEPLTYYPKP